MIESMTLTLLKGGLTVEDRRLDRVPSATFEHIDKYPLTSTIAAETDESVVIGVNWYSNFDRPETMTIRGRQRQVIGRGDLGRLRGGHATCLRNYHVADTLGWYRYYDQGQEGRCVEFASLRERTLSNRVRYDITSRFHYHWMQENDYWNGCFLGHGGETYEGTSVDAGLNFMRKVGPVRALPKGAPLTMEQAVPRPEDGISVFRWARDWNDVRTVLSVPDWMPGVPMLNSWGRSYPREVILLDDAGARLLAEDGEMGVVTDK
jgi:hypothetical protein